MTSSDRWRISCKDPEASDATAETVGGSLGNLRSPMVPDEFDQPGIISLSHITPATGARNHIGAYI
jgi:hypothetical protein